MHLSELGQGGRCFPHPFKRAALTAGICLFGEHGVPISTGHAGITQQLDATWVVCVCHVAQCNAEARAAGSGCSEPVLPQRNSGLLGRVGYANQSIVQRICMSFGARASSGVSIGNSVLQRRLKLDSWEVFIQWLSKTRFACRED